MSKKADSRSPRRSGKRSRRPARALIDDIAKGTFLGAVRRGAALPDAAAQAGFSLDGFYGARARDADFARGWAQALEASAAAMRFVPNNQRLLQLRKMRHVRFTAARQQAFLDHFAATADHDAAAAAAGVDRTTVYKLCRRDDTFAAAWMAALAEAYPRLEAEAVRHRLEAQARLRAGTLPKGEVAGEFDKVMKLLQRWDRRGGGIGWRRGAHGRQRRWTFEEAIALLDRRMRALGLRRDAPPESGEGGGRKGDSYE